MSNKNSTAQTSVAPKPGGAAGKAETILAAEDPSVKISALGEKLNGEKTSGASEAARIIEAISATKPVALVPIIPRLVESLQGSHKRAVQGAAVALPLITKVSPAKVAKHIETMQTAFESVSVEGQDGIVRTFAALCRASIAYQKRLEPTLKTALLGADAAHLLEWSFDVLPALKGEPHANAREAVEARLYSIPRDTAKQIAERFNIPLRSSYR